MSLPATLLAGMASLIAPARCPACRAFTGEAEEASASRDARGALGALLCHACCERLEWLEVACLACGLPRGPGLAESRRCSRCRTQSLGRVRTTTGLYRYRGPGRHVLRRSGRVSTACRRPHRSRGCHGPRSGSPGVFTASCPG